MRYTCEDGKMTLFFEGRIDTESASAVQRELDDLFREHTPDSVVIDAQKLDYISSAGLRVILRLLKRSSNVSMINASADVYDILEMTGFTELMHVEKAYRVFDVTGCEIIGEGANGKVYRVGDDLIIKVYKDADSLEEIKRERELSRTAFILGIPTAIPFDVVKVGDTYGSVFELLNARSFAELLRGDPSKLEYVAQKTVELAKMLHAAKAPDHLPRQSDAARGWLLEARGELDDAHFEKLSQLIEAISETDTMLHGDLHIKNIMLHGDEALLIDMDTLCKGHPIYELAFLYNAYEGFGICDKGVFKRFLGIDADTAAMLLHRILALYLDTDDESRIAEVKEKASVIGLLRVLRRTLRVSGKDSPEGWKLINACRERICRSVDHLETLTF
ncbi:MAG: anti-sigma factor antagonist [Ruminococcus sp.]|nr:anti-sigma factor antagonist [Ruminococcus sp.]